MERQSQILIKNTILGLLRERRKDEPRFDQKSLAKELDMRPSQLSEFLNGRRAFGKRAAAKYLKDKISTDEWKLIEGFFERESGKRPIGIRFIPRSEIEELEKEAYEDPYFTIIYTLFELEDFEPKISWFCKRTGLSPLQVEEYLESLCKLRVVRKEVKDGVAHYIRDPVRMRYDGVRVSRRNRKLRFFRIMQRRLERESMSKMVFIDHTFSTCPKELPKLKREIEQFIKKFDRVQRPLPAREVYTLMSCIFPTSE